MRLQILYVCMCVCVSMILSLCVCSFVIFPSSSSFSHVIPIERLIAGHAGLVSSLICFPTTTALCRSFLSWVSIPFLPTQVLSHHTLVSHSGDSHSSLIATPHVTAILISAFLTHTISPFIHNPWYCLPHIPGGTQVGRS